MVFENLLHPVLWPLLKLPHWLSIAILALGITIIINLIYKFATNQEEMKRLKEAQKDFQKKMKGLRNKPEKLMKLQKEAMETNMKYMSKSFKPMIYTFIPIIIIFGWMNAHMAYYPIIPNADFEVGIEFKPGATGTVSLSTIPDLSILSETTQEITDNIVKWTLSGDAGEYTLFYEYDGEEFERQLLIDEQNYIDPITPVKNDNVKKLLIYNKKVKPLAGFPIIGGFTWIWVYILFSIIFSMTTRKLMKIY